MDDPRWLDGDAIGGELPEDSLGKIKAELAPGERLLWADRGRPRERAGRGCFVAGGAAAGGLFLAAGVAMATYFGVLPTGGQGDPDAIGFSMVTALLGVVFLIGMAVAWAAGRAERRRKSQILYALTDRRAILWTPVPWSDGVEIRRFDRGRLARVHRVEYPDGSGDVIFTEASTPVVNVPEFTPIPVGFLGIADVRRVEDLTRQALAVPG